MIKDSYNIYKKCKQAKSVFLIVYGKYIYYRARYKLNILAHQHTTVIGIKNINTAHRLNIGVQYIGFSHPSDKTWMNIKGVLAITGNYSIGRGCRFDIGEQAKVTIGCGGYINVNTKLIIMHGLKIGDNCAIAWGCEFLDEDFHAIDYKGRIEKNKNIIIGNHVWIGAEAKIYQGTIIADGCVIASNSVVRGHFTEKNTIIGGNPAKVIKTQIQWT
ncbi:MAG: hypothetical protein COA88_05740 [Kordia sp.]|nr:MAG: hypothetical protein COA88_05740 [Kordia sp.]